MPNMIYIVAVFLIVEAAVFNTVGGTSGFVPDGPNKGCPTKNPNRASDWFHFDNITTSDGHSYKRCIGYYNWDGEEKNWDDAVQACRERSWNEQENNWGTIVQSYTDNDLILLDQQFGLVFTDYLLITPYAIYWVERDVKDGPKAWHYWSSIYAPGIYEDNDYENPPYYPISMLVCQYLIGGTQV